MTAVLIIGACTAVFAVAAVWIIRAAADAVVRQHRRMQADIDRLLDHH